MVLSLHSPRFLALAGIALAFGCAPGTPSDSLGGDPISVENAEAGASGSTPGTPSPETTRLLERMATSHAGTRFAGMRRIEQRYVERGVPQVLSYREDAASDGQGSFAIQVVEVLTGQTDEDLFSVLQNSRQVFTFNFRDFQVTDLDLFRQNYRMHLISDAAAVAGVPCLEFRVDRNTPGNRHYGVHVDPVSGLVLRWEQRTNDGVVLGLMEFETIDFDPDLSNYLLVERQFGGEPLDIQLELGGQVGFEVLTPNLLPSGFELESARVMTGALDRIWFKRVYTDGLSRMALLHREHEPIDEPTDERNLGQVLSMQAGPWNVVSGNLQGWNVILMAKTDADDLYQTLQSAF